MRLVSDTLIIAERNLIRLPRKPELLIAFTVQPSMFVLLFRYVFGGAIRTGGLPYVDFLIPGIIVQNIAFGGFVTALGLNEDVHKGLIDRFRSLPMARPAVLAGRTLADVVTNLLSICVLVVTGVIIGFSFNASVLDVIAGFGVLLLFGYAFSWVFAFGLPADLHLLGLRPRQHDADGAEGFRPGEPVHDRRRRDACPVDRPAGRQLCLGRGGLVDRDPGRFCAARGGPVPARHQLSPG